MRRLWSITAAILLVIFVLISGMWISFFYTPIVTNDQGVKYIVRPGISILIVINELQKQNIIKHPLFFHLLIHLKNDQRSLKAGEYLFPKGTTPSKMLDQMVTGSGMIYHPFTIIEGWNFKQVRAALSKEEKFTHATSNLSNAEIMSRIGHPELKPEGMFFPDTYFFAVGSTDLALLKRAFKEMQKKLNDVWQHRAPGLPFTAPYEALIAASLIEKEADLSEDRGRISSVLVNRLKKNMMLQFDPTVIYGMGSRFKGVIYRKDLLEKTPYNTYMKLGLPPTPIAMPSLASLKAATHPSNTDFLYFVAKNNNTGASQFSKTLSQHYSAVAEAKRFHPWFFNSALAKAYWNKILQEKMYDSSVPDIHGSIESKLYLILNRHSSSL